MFKKVLGVILSLVLVLSLAACSNKSEKQNENNNQTPVEGETGEEKQPEGEAETENPENSENEGETSQPVSSGKNQLIIGDVTQSNGDIYPYWTNNASDYTIFQIVMGYGTVIVDQVGQFQYDPVVVEEHTETENADGSKTFTFKLKDNLKWSNGEPITAKDYVFHMLFFSNPIIANDLGATNASEGYKMVGFDDYYNGRTNVFSGVRLLGDLEFSLTVDASNLPYYYDLSLASAMPSYMKGWVPEDVDIKDDGEGAYFTDNFTLEHIKDTIENYRMNMTAYSGPYLVDNYDETTNTYTLKINPEYNGNFEGQKAQIETVIYKFVLSETMMDELKTGSIDLIRQAAEGSEINAGLDLVEAGTHNFVEYPRNGYGRIVFICDRGPSQFPEVRRAIAYLLDRNQFVQNFTSGYGSVVNGAYGLSMWMVEEAEEEIAALNSYSYSLESAVAELEKGGWVYDENGNDYVEGIRYKKLDDGTLMPLILEWAASEKNTVSDLIAAMLVENKDVAAAGIKINQTTVTFNEMMDNYYQLKENNYNMYSMGIGYTPVYDRTQTYKIDGDANLNRINDEQLAKLAEDMVRVPAGDDEAFLEKFVAFQQRWNELLPDLPLYSNQYHDFFTSRLKGYEGITEDWGLESQLPYCTVED